MSISLPDMKLLWGRAGGLCSICQIKLSEDKKTTSASYPFGEQAHIVAEETEGPRGKSLLDLNERNCYHNLILLCPNCHTKIDKAPEEYPVEVLHRHKSQHELRLEKTRASSADGLRLVNESIYAEIVEVCAKLCMFENWEKWTSWPLSTCPRWRREWMDNFEEFQRRIMRVVWPGTLQELERALQTLSLNLLAAMKTFCQHCEPEEDDEWFKEIRFYKIGFQERYAELLEEYKDWIRQQADHMQEAAKSANWVAEVVRRELNPSFFAILGKFIVSDSGSVVLLEHTDAEKAREPAYAKSRWQALVDDDRHYYIAH